MELHQKKEENVTEEDSAECGDCYTLTAMEPGTRLWISHHEGHRTKDDATELFEDIEKKRNSDSEIPLFISDDWDAFEEGLLEVYGKVEQPPYKGIGRKPNPVLVPGEDLKYAQVCKKRGKGSSWKFIEYIGISTKTASSVVNANPSTIYLSKGGQSGSTYFSLPTPVGLILMSSYLLGEKAKNGTS